MQQPSASIELPQFTSLASNALNLAKAYISWRDPKSGEDIFTYFSRVPRQSGDEYGLRATLVREHILPAFHYTSSQIEYESSERYDLTLWSFHGQERRRIAIVETKSSSIHNLVAVLRKRKDETPIEQL